MDTAFARTDKSVLGNWWWTVDRWLLVSWGSLIIIGMVLMLSAGPPAANRIGVESYHFVMKQVLFIPLALTVIFSLALLPPKWIKRIAVIGFLFFLILTFLTLFIGIENNGARRWLKIASFSIQPSEFVKPFLIVFSAWMYSLQKNNERFFGNVITMFCLLLFCGVLLAQPDIGMTMLIVSVWSIQYFISGVSIYFVIVIVSIGIAVSISSYFFFPHVASRIDRFLDPSSGDTYQVKQSILAFNNGGLLGRGPGEGRVKETLPDAHTDFIFAVAGEEFGLLLCISIIILFSFIILRTLMKIIYEENIFIVLSVCGLSVQFALQASINMASSLNMIPTKGMTLPFISYGGSSLLALSIGMGMILSLTRRGQNDERIGV